MATKPSYMRASRELRDELKKLKRTKNESYEEVINELLRIRRRRK